jgi:CTP synthase
VIRKLGLQCQENDLEEWRELVRRIKNPQGKAVIALVGKYVELPDAYLSIVESLHHAGIAHQCQVEIKWIYAEDIEKTGVDVLKEVDGILVPGGFGERGVEGKIRTAQYARENSIPYFGICLGMQCAVIEFARNICAMTGAHSSEINPDTPYPVIDLMLEQLKITDKGGTMRLGEYKCRLIPGTKAMKAYRQPEIVERHRHRYEFNNAFRQRLVDCGLVVSGLSPDERLVEIVELADHPWFVGCQFHPEFQSRPTKPHPLFRDFIGAALNQS